MIKVLCTIVIISGTGYRNVLQLDGYMVNEAQTNGNERVLIDFGDVIEEPTARWVPENDCLYYDGSHLETQYKDYLKSKELGEKMSKEDRDKWKLINYVKGK